jgi:hypothetical protein
VKPGDLVRVSDHAGYYSAQSPIGILIEIKEHKFSPYVVLVDGETREYNPYEIVPLRAGTSNNV